MQNERKINMGVMTEEMITDALDVINTANLNDVYLTLIQNYSQSAADNLIIDLETIVKWYDRGKYMTKDD
jgi:hypothetical protein